MAQSQLFFEGRILDLTWDALELKVTGRVRKVSMKRYAKTAFLLFAKNRIVWSKYPLPPSTRVKVELFKQ